MENYQEINKSWWDQVVPTHLGSEYYDVQGFLSGKSSLQEAELTLLGDISGKRILHLQCHFGQDSISLARMGATVVGVDISDVAIEKARELANTGNQSVNFVCCDIYDSPKHIEGNFDIVFTSYGVICYLPDLDKWASVIAHFLKPHGQFTFVEFHPFFYVLDKTFQKIEYGYFKSDPFVKTTLGTYVDWNAPIEGRTVMWKHSLSEVITSLLSSGIQIKHFEEYDYVHYVWFPNAEEFQPRKYRFKHFGNKIPMMYSIVGIKTKE